MIIVASIPKTGTNFVFHEVLKDFVEGRNPKKNPDAKVWIHIYAERMSELMSRTDHPWIVPLRHPYLVAQTWKGHEWDLYTLKDMWVRLRDEIDPQHPMYFAIDSDARYAQLTAIEKRLGIKVDTRWPVIASQGLRKSLEEHERALFEPFIEFYESHTSS